MALETSWPAREETKACARKRRRVWGRGRHLQVQVGAVGAAAELRTGHCEANGAEQQMARAPAARRIATPPPRRPQQPRLHPPAGLFGECERTPPAAQARPRKPPNPAPRPSPPPPPRSCIARLVSLLYSLDPLLRRQCGEASEVEHGGENRRVNGLRSVSFPCPHWPVLLNSSAPVPVS